LPGGETKANRLCPGLTWEDLHHMTDMNVSKLSQWEHSNVQPRPGNQAKVQALFAVVAANLLMAPRGTGNHYEAQRLGHEMVTGLAKTARNYRVWLETGESN
jgi:glycine/serine hydroxymethyltransferase